jgi:hypothetical protein
MSTQNLSIPLHVRAQRGPRRSMSLYERFSGLRAQLVTRTELRSVLSGQLGPGQRDEVLMRLR